MIETLPLVRVRATDGWTIAADGTIAATTRWTAHWMERRRGRHSDGWTIAADGTITAKTRWTAHWRQCDQISGPESNGDVPEKQNSGSPNRSAATTVQQICDDGSRCRRERRERRQRRTDVDNVRSRYGILGNLYPFPNFAALCRRMLKYSVNAPNYSKTSI